MINFDTIQTSNPPFMYAALSVLAACNGAATEIIIACCLFLIA